MRLPPLIRAAAALAAVLALSASLADAQAVARPVTPEEHITVTPYPATKRPARVVTVETETWVDCGPCRKRDIVLEAVAQRYPRSAVVVFMHHYGPPLIPPYEAIGGFVQSPNFLNRARYYQRFETNAVLESRMDKATGQLKDCFELWIDGGCHPWLFTDLFSNRPSVVYDSLVAALDEELMRPAEAQLTLSTTLEGRNVVVRVGIDSLHTPSPTTHLRVVLVEDSLATVGKNGLPVQYLVWRDAIPSLTDTKPAEPVANGTLITARFDLNKVGADARRKNESMRKMSMIHDKVPYPAALFALEPKNLAIVAFLQDDATGHILQTAYARLTPP